MKKSTAPVGIVLALLILAATAAVAAASPQASDPAPPAVAATAAGAQLLDAIFAQGAPAAQPLVSSTDCGPRMYSCRPICQDGFELCYTQTCGTFVIVHCDPTCHPQCILPPS